MAFLNLSTLGISRVIRHPILELSCDTFVDNDIEMGDGTRQIAITGPNSSGKTVFMEQVESK